MRMRLGLLLCGPLLCFAGAGCRQEVMLPGVSTPTDAGLLDGRSRPFSDAGLPPGGDLLDGGADVGGGARIVCNGVSFKQFNPQVVLAVDRSSSMMEKPTAAAGTRFMALQNVLRASLRVYHLAIHFGYVEFPAAECQAGTCCAAGFLPPSYNPIRNIERRLNCDGMAACPTRTDDAPVGAALYDSRRHYDGSEQIPATRHVLLFTDGEPACAAPADRKSCDDAIKEVAELASTHKVRTTVFALQSNLAGNACLTDLAGVGSDNPLLVAADEAALRQQVDGFLRQLSAEACTFRLRQPLGPPERLVVVAEDRYTIKYDPTRTDGWAFDSVDDMSRFTVYGPWCDKLRTSAVDDVDTYVCNR